MKKQSTHGLVISWTDNIQFMATRDKGIVWTLRIWDFETFAEDNSFILEWLQNVL